MRLNSTGILLLLPASLLIASALAGNIYGDETAAHDMQPQQVQVFLKTYCHECHTGDDAEADFRLDDITTDIASGQDTGRWEKTLEMLEIRDMPPEDATQPAKQVRTAMIEWLAKSLKAINRGPDAARLTLPRFGNRVDHEELFSGRHAGPAYSPSRIWRKSKQIHQQFENQNRFDQGNSPFAPKGGTGFQDYAQLLANESTIKTLRINAKNYIAEILDGRMVFAKGANGKPDKTRPRREGKSRWREFNAVLTAEADFSDELLDAAVTRAFQLLLYRNPTADEQPRYAQGFLARAIQIAGARAGLESLLTAIMLSPEFVYRQEIGLGPQLPDGRRMLSPPEIAYAIAYALTDSPPDEELQRAVAEGKLSTREDVEREVRRLLQADTHTYWSYEINHTFEKHVEACPNPRILRFFREFFGYDRVFDVFKDKSRNANHKPQFLFKDADLFVLSILEKDRDVFRQLLTSNQYVVHYASPERAKRNLESIRKKADKKSAAYAKLQKGLTPVLGGYRGGLYYTTYGFEKETWDYPIEQPFPAPNRAGMLTHPAWLVAHSGNFDTDPVRRGKWIREHLLAGVIPEIPIGVDAALEEDPHKTLRERMKKTTGASCWRCHKKMNPLGLPFEAFDDFGRYRTDFYYDDEGKLAGTYFERQQRIKLSQQRKQPAVSFTTRPIDTTGAITVSGDPSIDGKVDNAFELVRRLADSPRVRQSILRHAFRYWMGRNETLNDSPTLMAADKAYVESGGSFKELLVSLLTSDSFLMRKDEGPTDD